MNNNMNKIAIVIPGIKKTGGPESLHNLAYNLQKKFNIDCRIVTNADTKKIKTLVFCTGKFYYDLLDRKEKDERDDVALVRLEQLFPIPTSRITKM